MSVVSIVPPKPHPKQPVKSINTNAFNEQIENTLFQTPKKQPTIKMSNSPMPANDIKKYQEEILNNLSQPAVKAFIEYLIIEGDAEAVPDPFHSAFTPILGLHKQKSLTAGMGIVAETSIQAFIEHAALSLLQKALVQNGWKPFVLRFLGNNLGLKEPLGDFVRVRIHNGKIQWIISHDGKWYKPNITEIVPYPADPSIKVKKQDLVEISEDFGIEPFCDMSKSQFITFKNAGKRTQQIKGTYLDDSLVIERSRQQPSNQLQQWDVGRYQDLKKLDGKGLERDHIPQDAWLYKTSADYIGLNKFIEQCNENINTIKYQYNSYFVLNDFIEKLCEWEGNDDKRFAILLNSFIKNNSFMEYLAHCNALPALHDAWNKLRDHSKTQKKFIGLKREVMIAFLNTFKAEFFKTNIQDNFNKTIKPIQLKIIEQENAIHEAEQKLEDIKKLTSDNAIAIALPADFHSKYSRTYMKRGEITSERMQNTNLTELILDQTDYFKQIPNFCFDLVAIGGFRCHYRQSLRIWKIAGGLAGADSKLVEQHDFTFMKLLENLKP